MLLLAFVSVLVLIGLRVLQASIYNTVIPTMNSLSSNL